MPQNQREKILISITKDVVLQYGPGSYRSYGAPIIKRKVIGGGANGQTSNTMKIRTYITILFICIATAYSYSQKVYFYTNGDTLIFNQETLRLANSKNSIKWSKVCYGQNQPFIPKSYIYPFFTTTFKESTIYKYAIKKNYLSLVVLCDTTLCIKEVMFDLYKIPITQKLVEKLHKVEKKLIGFNLYKAQHNCTNYQYIRVNFDVEFNKLFDKVWVPR